MGHQCYPCSQQGVDTECQGVVGYEATELASLKPFAQCYCGLSTAFQDYFKVNFICISNAGFNNSKEAVDDRPDQALLTHRH